MKQLLEKIEKTTEEVAERAKLFHQLDRELSAHAEAEELVFYVPLGDNPKAEDLVLGGFEEHAALRDLLVELRALGVVDEIWLAKFTVLKENVEQHIKEEEGWIFDKARQILSRMDAERMGEQMRKEKDRLCVRGVQRTCA